MVNISILLSFDAKLFNINMKLLNKTFHFNFLHYN